MGPQEIVHRAIEFRNPPRIPLNYHNRDFEYSDTLIATWAPATERRWASPNRATRSLSWSPRRRA